MPSGSKLGRSSRVSGFGFGVRDSGLRVWDVGLRSRDHYYSLVDGGLFLLEGRCSLYRTLLKVRGYFERILVLDTISRKP